MEAAKVTKIEKAEAVQPMHVLVKGRIESSRRFEGKSYTQIMTPAPDAYSRPQMVEVRSKSKVGDKGEEISITCTLGGYTRKAYEVKDKATGEISKLVPVDHTLDLIESD